LGWVVTGGDIGIAVGIADRALTITVGFAHQMLAIAIALAAFFSVASP
jgi:hypothetical protein